MLTFIILIVLANLLNAETINFGNEYNFEETVLIGDGSLKNVGYQIKGLLKIELLKKGFYLANLENLQLLVYSNKIKTSYGFIPHASNIDHTKNNLFLIEILDDKVNKIYLTKTDEDKIVNIKRAIANLFQFRLEKYEGEESDLSGICTVKYNVENANLITKYKHGCISPASHTIWGGKLKSKRKSSISIDDGKIVSITSWEEHVHSPYLSEMNTANYSSKLEIIMTSGAVITKEKFPLDDVSEIVSKLETEKGITFVVNNLFPENKKITCSNCRKFGKIIGENEEFLGEKYLGSSKSAEIFIEAVKAAKRSSSQDIYNVINAKKNRKLLPQLMDILGVAQTVNTHQAAYKFLKINTEKYDLNLCERYLWAISMSPTVEHHIVKEMQQLVQHEHKNRKLWQTIVLTLAAVVHKYNSQIENADKVVAETIEFLSKKIEDCSGHDECQQIYIRALGNIPIKESIPLLLKIVEDSPKKSGARAMKMISKMNANDWDESVIRLAEKVLLSSINYDSSARIFALEILLQSNPSFNRLCRIMSILQDKDKSRELKEYLLQRSFEISELNHSFKEVFKKVYAENDLNNYNVVGQGGLSTSFSRYFMTNGILSTSQEIIRGVLKQGSVNLNLIHNENFETPFRLGIFAGGLSSFVSDEESDDDDEIATAGLELTVLGVEVRPFVFFNGTGELTGHVWSGTASSLTPAFQALLLLEDNFFSIPTATGETLDLKLNSAVSVDLSGKIEISLWNRNSKSLVLNRAGVFIQNSITLVTPFIEANINADTSVDPELHLLADLDFSDGSSLCLRLQQPQTTIKSNNFKSLRLIGTGYKASRSRNFMLPVPGKTYSLNNKNDDMCKRVFNF